MLKRLLIALAFAGLLSPAYSAGTVPGFSLTPQFDRQGKIAPGCQLYVIQAGTTSTPQNAYQDSGLTLVQPNPMLCDATGRLPQWFTADGTVKIRLTDKNGTQIFTQDGLLVIGASSGGGGGSPVDPTTILATGDLKVTYGVGTMSGFVRANGRTIGSATSGATERANSDTSALFSFLWNADPNLVVSSGRGVSAAADFAANKTIALPDWRGRALAGLDDMGNSAAGRLTTTYFGAVTGFAGTTLGAAGGAESRTLSQANLPSATLATAITDPGHHHGEVFPVPGGGASFNSVSGSSTGTTIVYGINTQDATTGITASTQLGGSNTPHAIVPPMMLATIYIKL